MISKKYDKILSYVLIAIILISVVNFGFNQIIKYDIKKLGTGNAVIAELEEVNEKIMDEQYDLENQNESLINETLSFQGNPEGELAAEIYTKENRDEIKKQLALMEENKLIFTALPRNQQLENIATSTIAGMSGNYSDYGQSTLERYYTMEETDQDNIVVLRDKEDKAQSYDIFLFGPYGAVLHFDDNILEDEYKAGMRDPNLMDISFSNDFSFLRELGDNDED